MKTPLKIYRELLPVALNSRNNARAQYSKFKVGAAIIDSRNNIFSGCNVESSSFGLTVCAERNAVCSAICSGAVELKAILIVADTPEPVTPCGACRQFIYDHAPDITVITANLKGDFRSFKISSLLRYPFSFKK